MNDLARLDAIDSGLGDKAVAFVLDDGDETVLSTLSTRCQGDPLEVGTKWVQDDTIRNARRDYLAQQRPFDVAFSARYARVLAASANEQLPGFGSEAVPVAMRAFFGEACLGIFKRKEYWKREKVALASDGFQLEAALAVTEALDGTIVDLVDVLYHQRDSYSAGAADYRQTIDINNLLREHAHEVCAAGERLPAEARVSLVKDLNAKGLADAPTYVQFLVSRAGDSAKAVRQVAGPILGTLPAELVEPLAIKALSTGAVTMRTGMVDVLAALGTSTARSALETHLESEKTARVRAAIESVLSVAEQTSQLEADQDDENRYRALDGDWVTIPPLDPLPDDEPHRFQAEDREALEKLIEEENERSRARFEALKKQGHGVRGRAHTIKRGLAQRAIDLFNLETNLDLEQARALSSFLSWGVGATWTHKAAAKLTDEQSLRISSALSLGLPYGYYQNHVHDRMLGFLQGPQGDVRHLNRIKEEVLKAFGNVPDSNSESAALVPDGLIRLAIRETWTYTHSLVNTLPAATVWPYLAQHLDVFDEAFGMRPQRGRWPLSRPCAVDLLGKMPATPLRYLAPLLEVATGETKSGRAQARQLLANAPGISERLLALLDDSRQAVRAGAAQWIMERRERSALPALKKRLKKEKSEVARAAILTTLDSLGEDLTSYVGPKALLAEAEKGLKKAKLDKLDWLGLEHLPKLRYRKGGSVPVEVLQWWLFLAVKLKQPGGNALFDIYLDQLAEDDAATLSSWVLDSWMNFDTARPSESDGNAYAQQHAKARHQSFLQWVEDYTQERAFADLKREFMSQYLNSGAASKGLLALAKRAAPGLTADRVRSYLKQHGSRTSQASALLELLAAMGDSVSLQVVIAAATRLKQKGVQKFAAGLVERVAEANNWSLDELADRTIPVAGLDEGGMLKLVCGESEKTYEAKVNDGLTFTLFNPEGKQVKSLPSGQDEATKGAKKQLSASRRELKQVVSMQSARLYEALCAGRSWPLEDWQRDFYEHPIMRRLVERVVWLGLDGEGEPIGSFRPTAEGDFTDVEDDDVDLTAFHSVRLAYGAQMADADAGAWAAHLGDYEIKPLFAQFGRSLLTLAQEQGKGTVIEDRKGWVTDTFTIRGTASKLVYERGEAMDGGYFNEYTKSFSGAGIAAVVTFSGNCVPEENVAAALISLHFERYAQGSRVGGSLRLSEVPSVLLSECWNDYRQMASKATYDEHWERKMPWT